MRKISSLATSLTYLLSAPLAFAQNQIQITPTNGGYNNITDFINAALRLAFIVALLIVLIMFVWGAIEWIASGGDKEAIDKARKRITNALIGLVILAVAFAVVNLAGTFVGINLLGVFTIPSPNNATPPLPVPTPGTGTR